MCLSRFIRLEQVSCSHKADCWQKHLVSDLLWQARSQRDLQIAREGLGRQQMFAAVQEGTAGRLQPQILLSVDVLVMEELFQVSECSLFIQGQYGGQQTSNDLCGMNLWYLLLSDLFNLTSVSTATTGWMRSAGQRTCLLAAAMRPASRCPACRKCAGSTGSQL